MARPLALALALALAPVVGDEGKRKGRRKRKGDCATSKTRRHLARPMPDEAPLIDALEAARRVRAGNVLLLDVREPYELQRARIEGALHIPMRQVPARLAELPKERPIVVVCHHGGRSQAVADWLVAQGYDAQNMAGGIAAWSDEVDPTVPKY